MSTVRNDSEDLRLFAGQFSRFQEELYQNTLSMKGNFNRLGDTWQDEQYVRFGEKIDDFAKRVAGFLQRTENVPDGLNRLADLSEDHDRIK